LDRLDILIENAGIATPEYRSTTDGWEETYRSHSSLLTCRLQVNNLSTFLLAFLLLPLLRKTTTISPVAPRLIILSSLVHTWTDIREYRDEENIYQAMNDKTKFNDKRYPASKLLDTLFTCELGSRLASSKHPEDHKISVSGQEISLIPYLIPAFIPVYARLNSVVRTTQLSLRS
jgi:retinol dehydrogenase 12